MMIGFVGRCFFSFKFCPLPLTVQWSWHNHCVDHSLIAGPSSQMQSPCPLLSASPPACVIAHIINVSWFYTQTR